MANKFSVPINTIIIRSFNKSSRGPLAGSRHKDKREMKSWHREEK